MRAISRFASVSHSLFMNGSVATKCNYGGQKKNALQQEKTTTSRVRDPIPNKLFMRTP